MKIKSWNVTVIDNPNTVTVSENDEFYTTDTEAFLAFDLQDRNFNPISATITLHNLTDGSIVNEDISVVNGVVKYEMRHEVIKHAGVWRAQLVYEQDKDGVSEKYTSKVVSFGVSAYLLDAKEPPLFLVENWNNFLLSAKSLIEGWRQSEALRAASERKRAAAEDSRVSEENKRVSAESDRESNEIGRQSSEANRNAWEAIRESNESDRQSNESGRESKESDRRDNELVRQSNESGRQSNEDDRQSNESIRKSNESIRESNESIRESNESIRQSNETDRESSEVDRQDNESIRQAQEESREIAENQREETIVTLKDNIEKTNVGKINFGGTWYTPQIVTELPASPSSDIWYIILE